jgi:D-alanine-D-alanine ligase
MNIIVLGGGISAERNVSIATSKAIVAALRNSGHNVKFVDPIYGAEQPDENILFQENISIGKYFPSSDDLEKFSSRKIIECINSSIFDDIDIVFLGLHGKFGEDGKIQALLELRNIKYTGSGVVSSAMAMDKDISKKIFRHSNIPVPEWFTICSNSFNLNSKTDLTLLYQDIEQKIKFPVVIKPVDEGSTVGLTILPSNSNLDLLKKALIDSFSYSKCIMAEKFIEGREITVAVLGETPLPVLEIIPKNGFYDYEHKYTKGMTEYICPADIPSDIEISAKQYALIAHKALNCKAYSRVDFRLKPDGSLFCLEINTLPGLTELSLVPKAAQAVGINFTQLLEKIIELSLI